MPARSLSCPSHASAVLILPIAAVRSLRLAATQSASPLASSAASFAASSAASLNCLDEPVAIVRTRRRHHELGVLHILAVVEPELVERHVDEMRAGHRSEFVEGREEFAVAQIGRAHV